MRTSNDSDVAKDNGAVLSSTNNDDEKDEEYEQDSEYNKRRTTTTTSLATSTSNLPTMDNSHVNCNFEVDEVAIQTNLAEVSRIKQLDFVSPLSLFSFNSMSLLLRL